MARKFIPTALNQSEMTFTLDQPESRLKGLRIGVGFFAQQ